MFERYEECLKGRHLVGDPVDVVTGANTDVKFDFELPGPLPLRWRRYYSSARNTVACPLGWGHSHELDHTIDRDLDGLIYVDPLGTVVEFPELNEDGEEAIASGFLLRRLAARRFEIEQSDGPTRVFKFPAAGPAQLVALRQDEHAIKLQRSVTGRLEWIIDSRGVRTRVATDHAGRVTGLYLNKDPDRRRELPLMLYRYDEAGNLVQARDGHGATLRFQYDPNNRMTRWTDRLGYSFHFEYDAEGRCVHTFGDDGLLEVFLEYYPAQKCTIVRHADGGVWTYYYNDVGSLTEIRAPDCGATRFNFDESGRVIEEVDPNGNVTKLLYDGLGRHCLRVDPLGYVHPPAEGEPDRYDPSEYTLPQTPLEWEYGNLLDPARIIAPEDPERTLGHAISNGNGNGHGYRPRERRKFDFNRNLIEHQDRDGVVYRSTYKSWNLPHNWIDHHGNVTAMAYNADEKLSRLTDPGGTISEYAYDAKKRLVEVRRQGRVRDRYTYDPADNLIEKRDEDSRLLLRWEIGPGNLRKVRHLSSGGTHEFRHDDHGRIVSARTPDGETTRSFDLVGRLLSDERDGMGVVHGFVLGSLAESVYLGNFAVVYDEDEEGLLIVDPTGGEHRLRVDESGQASLILQNGTVLASRYDRAGRCLAKTRFGGSRDGEAWERTFDYSAEGDLLRATDNLKGTTLYEHSAHRLTGETRPGQTRQEYRYDAAGNLVEQPGLAAVRIGEANKLAQANGDQFTYNNRCHVARRQSWCGEFTYENDSLDMLTRCVINGQEWTAAYDAFCRRIRKTWQGRTTRYFWDGFRLSSELRHDGTVRLYLYLDEAALVPFMFVEYDSVEADPSSGRRFYVFTNQVGAPIRVEDDHGDVVWSAEISPYGQAHIAEDSCIDLPLRFPGHYHDPELDLHYNRFRYYSPELGRYIQSDPLGIAGGINLYAYSSEPITAVDLDGLMCGDGLEKGVTNKRTHDENSKEFPTPPRKANKRQGQLTARTQGLLSAADSDALTQSDRGSVGDTHQEDLSYNRFGPFTPTKTGEHEPSTPTDEQYIGLARRVSGDFSELFQEKLEHNPQDFREKTTDLQLKDVNIHRMTGTTSTPGRKMNGLRALGDTKYAKILPTVARKTGLAEGKLAQALLDGLFDGEKYKETLESLKNEAQKDALNSTLLLLHNEIIHRSSANLLSIVGVLNRRVQDPDSERTLAKRFSDSGLFVPVRSEHKKSGVGGQRLSRLHQDRSDVPQMVANAKDEAAEKKKPNEKVERDLLEIYRNKKKSLAKVAKKSDIQGLGDDFKSILERYVENLNKHWTFNVRKGKGKGKDKGKAVVTGNELPSSPPVYRLQDGTIVDRGQASGENLNCLLDTLLQLRDDSRGPSDQEAVTKLRSDLATVGDVAQDGMIDGMSDEMNGIYTQMNLNVHMYMPSTDGSLEYLGPRGMSADADGVRTVHMLHEHNHFQPLWPRGEADTGFAGSTGSTGSTALGSDRVSS